MKRTTDYALIIFVKNLIEGKVKSRLAKTIGDSKALEVYRLLLEHTRKITAELNHDRFVFYNGSIAENDSWSLENYHKYLQQGNDLGERMKHAFEVIFNLGYRGAAIIGSDCYELRTTDINAAFELLGEAQDKENMKSIVIGPANDGGYYLLGMGEPVLQIFSGIPWSTPEVLDKTLEKLEQMNIPHQLLPILTDIDREADLPDNLRVKAGLLKTRIPG